jgi:glucosamine-6-phosphate deaminase
MEIRICETKAELGQWAAHDAARAIRQAIHEVGAATIIVATGASQFETLAALIAEPDIAWHRVTAFHLDEYLGLPISHPASFRRYLWERFVSKLRMPLAAFHYLDGEATDPHAECRRVGDLLCARTVDVALIGIGENGHLAFNDPPADFETREPYLVVELDEVCRRQQLGEGWFESFDAVPRRAISMSCREILRARRIVCSVPDRRKAEAVRNAVKGPVTPTVPASILQEHPNTTLYLDREAASRLS